MDSNGSTDGAEKATEQHKRLACCKSCISHTWAAYLLLIGLALIPTLLTFTITPTTKAPAVPGYGSLDKFQYYSWGYCQIWNDGGLAGGALLDNAPTNHATGSPPSNTNAATLRKRQEQQDSPQNALSILSEAGATATAAPAAQPTGATQVNTFKRRRTCSFVLLRGYDAFFPKVNQDDMMRGNFVQVMSAMGDDVQPAQKGVGFGIATLFVVLIALLILVPTVNCRRARRDKENQQERGRCEKYLGWIITSLHVFAMLLTIGVLIAIALQCIKFGGFFAKNGKAVVQFKDQWYWAVLCIYNIVYFGVLCFIIWLCDPILGRVCGWRRGRRASDDVEKPGYPIDGPGQDERPL